MDIIRERLLGGKKSVVAETRTLLNSARRNVETLLGEVEKNSFIAWPSRRGPSGLMCSRLCNTPGGGGEKSYSFQGARCVELKDILRLIGIKGNFQASFLVSNSLCTCGQQFSSERGRLPIKTI